jgi:hypothetical protein
MKLYAWMLYAWIGVVFIIAIILQPQAAHSGILPQCRAYLPAERNLPFAHDKHRKWYSRFWTGSCAGLSAFDFCKPGSPNWHEVMQRVSREVPPAEQKAAIQKACRLGHLIGFEWAKDNNVRCIHTSDFPSLFGLLQTRASMQERLTRLEAVARAKLGCRH